MTKKLVKFGACMLSVCIIAVFRRSLIINNASWLIILILFIGSLYMAYKMFMMLRTAAKIRSELKNHTIQTVSAIILKTSEPTIRHTDTTKKAYARYTLQNREYEGEMICAFSRKIYEGNPYTLYVSKSTPKYFAMSEQQIKNAFLTYLTFFVITLIISMSALIIGIMYYASLSV